VSGAVVKHVTQDFDGACGLLAKSRKHIEDARREDNHPSSRFLLAYQASFDLMNALLMAAGLRITSGLGAHMKRIETGEQLMPDDTELFERVDDARQQRNRIAHDGAATDADVVDEFTNDVQTLADKVANYMDAAKQLYDAQPEEELHGDDQTT
jgi:uncharacterized protein YutE (UPF0331/DUF86 family)